jgi:hypothetical protein
MTLNSDHGYRTDTATGTAPIPVRVPIWNLRSITGTAPIPVTGTAPIPLYRILLSTREGQDGRQVSRCDGSRWRRGAGAGGGREASPHDYARTRDQRPPDCLEQALGPLSGKAFKRNSTNCASCDLKLTDDRSRARGFGLECVKSADAIARLLEAKKGGAR